MSAPRVLLVEDEAALLDLLKKYLERLGYEVDACANAEDALALFEAGFERYLLVMTDLTLPRITGEEMLDRMRAINPAVKAIVSSGYPYSPRTPQIVFLQKPFLPKMLVETIEKLLKN